MHVLVCPSFYYFVGKVYYKDFAFAYDVFVCLRDCPSSFSYLFFSVWPPVSLFLSLSIAPSISKISKSICSGVLMVSQGHPKRQYPTSIEKQWGGLILFEQKNLLISSLKARASWWAQ